MVIFITSHKSPDTCITLDTLLKYGYNGEYYIVIDDEDPLIKQYKTKYGDNLFIFNKTKYISCTDSGHSIAKAPKACVLYARNAIEDKAKELNLDTFIMCDDDIKDFVLRPIDDTIKKVLTIHLKNDNINYILEYYKDFMISSNSACLSFGTPNIYFGGYEALSTAPLNRRSVSNFFFRNMKFNINWTMPMEDFNTAIKYGSVGLLFFSPPGVEVIVKPQYTQSNYKNIGDGMSEFYENSSSFTRAFYSTMIGPSYVKPALYKGKYIPKLDKNSAWPKILSYKFKK